MRNLNLTSASQIKLDASALSDLDTTGAWLLLQLKARAAEGKRLQGFDVPEVFQSLIDTLGSEHPAPITTPSERRASGGFTGFLETLGSATERGLRQAYEMLGYFGLISVETSGTVIHPRRLRLPALLNQIEQTGLRAMPIVGVLSFAIGIVLAYQGAEQLKRFGAELFTIDLLGIGTLREVGGLMAAIMLAGRSGSAFTAQIGTMKLNQEIDAIETFGLDTIQLLVLPRVLGLLIALPLLTLYADAMMLLGGAVMCFFYLNITATGFLNRLHEAINLTTLWIGLVKAPVYAFVIALVGCFEGLRVTGSAASVGIQTTRAVVESVFLVILIDGAFSVLFSILGI